MSSGSILLQQLRSRQSKSSSSIQQKANNKSSNESDITSSSCDGDDNNATAVAQINTSDDVAKSQRATIAVSNGAKKKKVIEVCLGPDCAVAGGGAALLEIEDVVLQQCSSNESKDTKIIVKAGGCRDQCTEGPNVRILSCNGGGIDVGFHRVNSPEACRRVVNSLQCQKKATPTINELHAAGHSMYTTAANSNKHHNDSSDISSSDNVVARLLSRKEDTRRWKVHRERAAKERRLQAISRNQGT